MSNLGSSDIKDVATFFEGSRLTLARQLAGLRKNALAERIGRTPTAVAAYENGTKRPSPATVAQLALALKVDPAFFAYRSTSTRSLVGLPHFRSLRSTTQVARDQAQAYGLLAVEVAATLERYVELPALNLPYMDASVEDLNSNVPELAARQLRNSWNIPSGPVGHLLRTAENHGVLVVFSPPQTASVDAYSLESTLRPTVLLNPVKKDYFRQRWDLAHEIGHLIMHKDAEPGSRVVEEQANRFAAELLLPEDQLIRVLPQRADWQTLSRLKSHWRVSLQALLFRARRLGVMTDVTYRNAMTTVSARGWRRSEPGPMPALEQPSLLPQAMSLLIQSGISERDLATECNVPIELLEKVTARQPLAATFNGFHLSGEGEDVSPSSGRDLVEDSESSRDGKIVSLFS